MVYSGQIKELRGVHLANDHPCKLELSPANILQVPSLSVFNPRSCTCRHLHNRQIMELPGIHLTEGHACKMVFWPYNMIQLPYLNAFLNP